MMALLHNYSEKHAKLAQKLDQLQAGLPLIDSFLLLGQPNTFLAFGPAHPTSTRIKHTIRMVALLPLN